MNAPLMDFAQGLQCSLMQSLSPQGADDALEATAGEAVFTLRNKQGELLQLQLTPPQCQPQRADAKPYFNAVKDIAGLVDAYHSAVTTKPFETSLFSDNYLSDHAKGFVSSILANAQLRINDDDARLIANFVVNLDIYVAVKAVESLLYNPADLALLRLAVQRDWQVHFDHLAIRCGCQSEQAAEKVVQLLKKEHGYNAPQIASEAYYQFPDGWNAYPLYKMLDNGQFLRLFIDQSDAGAPLQIIQHWNYVYGFTAHHLGIRATRLNQGERQALDLQDIESALTGQGVALMTPTGMYTQGLLQQVFTRPQREDTLPDTILDRLQVIDPTLNQVIGNAKLLEIVSRREMPTPLKPAYFALYGLEYEPDNPLHSAAAYQYFLPAQAAHVIRSSVQTSS